MNVNIIPTLEFFLTVDASAKGLDAVHLYHLENELIVTGNESPTLTPAEKKYDSFKLEFLGVKWTVCNYTCLKPTICKYI